MRGEGHIDYLAKIARPDVREEIRPVDLVVPSLDAARPDSFQRINRPHPDLRCADIVAALEKFRSEYNGKIWLEIFVVEGVNTDAAEVEALP